MRLPRAKRGRTSLGCSASVLAAAPLTRYESTTPRICYRSSASSTVAASTRLLSLPRSKPARRRSRTKRLRSPLRDRPTRKTHSQHPAVVAPRWTATVPIRVELQPADIHPASIRNMRSRVSNRARDSSRQLVRPVSNPQHSRIYNDPRRSKVEHNLLIQARHHRPPEITLV